MRALPTNDDFPCRKPALAAPLKGTATGQGVSLCTGDTVLDFNKYAHSTCDRANARSYGELTDRSYVGLRVPSRPPAGFRRREISPPGLSWSCCLQHPTRFW